MNVCGACGQDFGSAFDRHRIGKHAYTYEEGLRMSPPREDGRRCLTVAEMTAQGFVRNAFGRWTLASTLRHGQAFTARTSLAQVNQQVTSEGDA